MAIEKELLDQLLEGRDPETVFTQDGLLDELKKGLSERVLNAELDAHLDAETADGKTNRHNGRSQKTVLTGTSKVTLDIPRDRAGCPFHLFHRIMPAKLCKGMRMSAASTSPQRGIDRIRAGVVRPRGVRNGDADRRPWARKRPFQTRPAERVDHPVCPCRATGVSLNRDNSRGMSQECAANAVR